MTIISTHDSESVSYLKWWTWKEDPEAWLTTSLQRDKPGP